jgi:phage shock protein PspC (stress-responsive transcriptional regulator)
VKKLERSHDSRAIAGVAGGLGEYFNLDPIIFRIAFVLLALAKGIGILVYAVCWIAMPERPKDEVVVTTESKTSAYEQKSDLGRFLPGFVLIAIGLVFLLDNIFYWFDLGHLWPLIIIGVGVILIVNSLKNKNHTEQHADECRES